MYEKERKAMIEMQLLKRGIKDSEILRVMNEMPRHIFIPVPSRSLAYADLAIPIGHSQTISQPYIVARMLEILNPQSYERILEIGSGSGYVIALISKLSDKVIGLEKIPELVEFGRKNLEEAGVKNAKIINMDGSAGAMSYCPYDKIIISAACPKIPEELFVQLKPNGFVVAPVGDRVKQVIVKATKTKNGFVEEKFESCSFVPLVGKNGFKS